MLDTHRKCFLEFLHWLAVQCPLGVSGTHVLKLLFNMITGGHQIECKTPVVNVPQSNAQDNFVQSNIPFWWKDWKVLLLISFLQCDSESRKFCFPNHFYWLVSIKCWAVPFVFALFLIAYSHQYLHKQKFLSKPESMICIQGNNSLFFVISCEHELQGCACKRNCTKSLQNVTPTMMLFIFLLIF